MASKLILPPVWTLTQGPDFGLILAELLLDLDYIFPACTAWSLLLWLRGTWIPTGSLHCDFLAEQYDLEYWKFHLISESGCRRKSFMHTYRTANTSVLVCSWPAQTVPSASLYASVIYHKAARWLAPVVASPWVALRNGFHLVAAPLWKIWRYTSEAVWCCVVVLFDQLMLVYSVVHSFSLFCSCID